MHNLFPKSAAIENIAFFNRAELFISLSRGFKAYSAYSLNFAFGITHCINGNLFAVFFIGFMLAEINSADKLSYDNEIDSLVNY